MRSETQLPFTRFLLVSIIAFSSLSVFSPAFSEAERKLRIDDEGNIILTKPEPNPQETTADKPIPNTTPAQPESKTDTPRTIADEKLIAPTEAETRSTEPLRNLQSPKPASITARLIQVRTQPDAASDPVVLLRAGDRVQIIAETPNYLKIRYLIDREFPVEGFLPKESIREVDAGERTAERLNEQDYTPEARTEEIRTQVTELPSSALPEKVQLPGATALDRSTPPQLIPGSGVSGSNESKRPSLFESLARETKGKTWIYNSEISGGRSSFGESVRTKNQTSDFLDYDLTGLLLRTSFTAMKPERVYPYGFFADYSFTYFDTEIGGTGTGVVQSSVQAQKHQLGLGALGFKNYPLRYGIQLEPELRFSVNFLVLTTNQLRTDNPTNSFPILFGYWSLSPALDLKLRTYLPYSFVLSPIVGTDLYYMFQELDTQQIGTALVGTGTAKSSFFNFRYGAELLWNMESLKLKNADIRMRYLVESVERKFSGFGNRAGIATEDAKSKITLTHLELGLNYRF